MRTRLLLAVTALLVLGACRDNPLEIQDQGSLQATNTTPHAVVSWHFRDCGTTAYDEEISLRRLPEGRIPPGGSVTVQVRGDRCFDHRFTLANGVTIEEPAITVVKLDILFITIAMPADPGAETP
jgi:hypothetical protein